jgi:ATP-dependent DNA helicase PIF1
VEQTPRRSELPEEQRTSRNRHLEMLAQGTAPPAGSQLNPVDLASSPEPERRQSSKKRNKKKNFYAVAAGHVPGIYLDWAEVEHQIKGFSGAKHQGFANEDDALHWLRENMDVYHAPNYRAAEKAAERSELERLKRMYMAAMQSENASHASLSSANQTAMVGPCGRDMRTGSDAADFISLPLTTEGADAPRMVDNSDPDPILKPEQQKVVDLILEGHNVFYTGSAGCGKSTILKAFVKQLKLRGKSVKIVAPTNLAALNVGGVTTWSYAGWTPDSMKKSLDTLMKNSSGKEVWERFDNTDVLVIDEISMVENLLFERLNYIMKASIGEGKGGGPFGGVQIIVTGDVSIYD